MDAKTQKRRAFVHAENNRLGAFLGDDPLLVSWRREYRCACGRRFTSPGEIFDHATTCPEVAGRCCRGVDS